MATYMAPKYQLQKKQFSITRSKVLLIVCLLGSSLWFGCKKENTAIPATIEALTKQTNCTCEPFIDAYKWHNKTVYIQSCKGPACLCSVLYYNAQGEMFSMPQGYTFNDFFREAEFVRNIWTCKPM
jgi:hypothetical protein